MGKTKLALDPSRCDAVVFDIDGVVARRAGLAGQPAPDVFLEAARRLAVQPARCAIVEDARAGVRAGRRGGFGWVIGVARGDGAEGLARAGADVVVCDLSGIAVGDAGDGERPIDALPSALDRVAEIAARAGAREVVLFLDFDGTLSPIVERPEEAELPPATRTLLAKLAGDRGVAIVSGRDLDDLRRRVGLDALYYAGSHGFHLAGPGGFARELPEGRHFLTALDDAEAFLSERLASIEGAQIERKRYAVALHFRRAAPGEAERVREVAEAARERSGGALRIGTGRKVLELRPDIDWDKGKAIAWLLEALGIESERSFAVYVGDDVTDEDAFQVLGSGGLGVVVHGREGRTLAQYALEDPDAVRRFLARLDETLRRA